MSLRQSAIQRSRSYGGCLSPGQRVIRRLPSPNAEERVAVGQSRISERIARVLIDSLIEILDRLMEGRFGALVPVVASFSVEAVRFRVFRVVLCDKLALTLSKVRKQRLRRLFGERIFEKKGISAALVKRCDWSECVLDRRRK